MTQMVISLSGHDKELFGSTVWGNTSIVSCVLLSFEIY